MSSSFRQRSEGLRGVLFGASFWLNGVLYISAGVFFGTLLVVFALFAAWRHAEKAGGADQRFQVEHELG